MLGGGNFITQDKILAGAYINFISAATASAALSERGIATVPFVLDWGIDGAVFTVTAEDFQKNSLKIFGYDYTADQLKPMRELFRNIHTLHAYKLNDGVAAQNTYALAKYKGIRGNDLKTVITANVDVPANFDVSTYLGTVLVDKQTVAAAANLVPNDYCTFKVAALALTAGLAFTGGTNGAAVTGTEYQSYLDKIEAYAFNVIGCPSSTSTINDLFVAFAKRMRDTVGAKFQAVVYQKAADYEGVIPVENPVTDDTNVAAAVYWMTGAAAGCAINKSNTNKVYDGEYTINTNYKQSELEAGIKAGKLMFHKVGDTVRVLSDINSFVTVTDTKSSDFSSNQTIRVLDQIANDIATLFNTKYLGNVPNDASGRISFWNDVVKHHQELETIRAIEGFKSEDVTVLAGDTKKSIVVNDVVMVTNAMEQLYMTTVVQ